MRFLLKVSIPVESGNKAAKAGVLGSTIQSILADLKPEAVYFTDDNGQRAGYIFLEMQDASEIPAIAEPWFLAFNAAIEIHPVMRPEDLARAGGAIDKAVKKYGSGSERMPAVFVHGVPDTQQVWDAVIARLDRKDVVTLSLPGFGCP